jgi:hypothetical protein
VVSPVDQRYDAAAGAVSVTEPLLQRFVVPEAVIVGAGFGSTFTVIGSERGP